MSARRHAPPQRIVLAGLHGHGRWHLANVRRLADRGLVELAGVCDPRPPTPDLAGLVGDAVWATELDELIMSVEPAVTILCTPIHTHVDLALAAATSGSDVLLEKPPAPSLAEFDRLASGLDRLGARCQVGFQNLGSGAIGGLHALIADGDLGELSGIGGAGLSIRDAGYFHRSGWAGKRRLTDVDVVDGVLTNPYVHAVAAAIRLADAEAPGSIVGTELELYRANPIESDDTSVTRLLTSSGVTIVVAATLCAVEEAEPVLTVHGSRGRATWSYKHDIVRVDTGDAARELHFDRRDLLEDLIANIAGATDSLLVPLASTRAVTEFVDAVRRAPEPALIPADYRRTEGVDDSQRCVVDGVDDAVRQAADRLTVFSEQAVPWAATGSEASAAVALVVGGREVARYELAPRLDGVLSPRPFLHPVRTLGGVVVSDREPEDHRWHLGVGVAIQDVGGVNFWGGRTYVRGDGYHWRDDHGTVRHLEWRRRAVAALAHDLAWIGPDRRCRLVERRSISAAAVGAATDRWMLEFQFNLRNVSGRTLSLGSPGSNGRSGGGYGGFFWRLPRTTATSEVRTDRGSGEAATHGTVAPWISWATRVANPHDSFTLLLAPGDAATADDPWFVRMADYPGIGSAIAWEHPVILASGESTTRCVRALVVDGIDHDPTVLHGDLHRSSSPIEET